MNYEMTKLRGCRLCTPVENASQCARRWWVRWHGRPARESRARCACHNQTDPLRVRHNHWRSVDAV